MCLIGIKCDGSVSGMVVMLLNLICDSKWLKQHKEQEILLCKKRFPPAFALIEKILK